MKPLTALREEERTTLFAEYEDLLLQAKQALQGYLFRGRPNWEHFYEVHRRINDVVLRIERINQGEGD